MSHLSLRFLGTPEVTLGGQPVTGFDSVKVRALLAYLVIESDRPHRRESLAALLWPEKADSAARRNLRNALSNLRGIIGDRSRAPDDASPILLVTRESVQFNRDSDCWVDVRAFEMLIERQPLGLPDVDQLAKAVSLYRGAFLEGFSINGSAAFDDWMLLVRDRLHRQASSGYQSLIEQYAEQSAYAEACAYAWRRVALEPWREDAYRQLMRNLALSGERTTALAQYDICREMLAEEFGVEPSPKLQRLYAQIRDGTLVGDTQPVVASVGPLGAVSVASASEPVAVAEFELPSFAGRDREMAALDAHLEQALAGHGRVVFVTGEAGEGKTALIQAFAYAALRKHPSLIPACGTCNAYTGVGDPYLPFREILEMLAGDIEARAATVAVGGQVVARLVNVFPTMAQTLLREGRDLIDVFVPGSHLLHRAGSYAWQDNVWSGSVRVTQAWIEALRTQVARKAAVPANEVQQEDLFRQYTAVLKTLARSAPLLLVLDDLQWADAGSVSLLFHLGRRLEGSPILVVGAYRSEEVALGRDGGRHPLESVVNEFTRTWGDVTIDMGRSDGAAFVEALLDSEPNVLDAGFRETLTRQTEGHPLFTVELLRGMQARGDLTQDGHGRWQAGRTLDWTMLPERVEAVIAERVERLPALLRTTLRTASVEGEVFTAEVLASVQAADALEMVRVLSGELDRRHHLVRAQGMQHMGGRRLSRYRFRHILFQKYLYDRLDAVERSHLHAEVGAALQESYAGGDEALVSMLPQLAWHAEQAGMLSEAVDYYQQAGDQALHMSANQEACDHFRRALELLKRLPESPDRDKRELALQLVIAAPLTALTSWGGAETRAAYGRALALSRTVGDPSQRVMAIMMMQYFHSVRSEHREALDLSLELSGMAQHAGDPILGMMAYSTLCTTLLFVGDLKASLAAGEETQAVYTLDERRSLIYTLGQDPAVGVQPIMLYGLWYLGFPDRALKLSEEALALAEELEHPMTMYMVLEFSKRLHRWRREPAQVTALLDRQRKIWRDHGVALGRAGVLLDSAWVLSQREEYDRAIDQYREGLALWKATGMENHLTEFWSVLAQMYAQAGQVETALSLLEDALARIAETEERYHEAEVYRLRGEFRLQQGGPDQVAVETDFRRAIEISRRQEARMLELRAMVSLCRLWLAQGRAEKLAEGREMLSSLYGWFTEGFETWDLREAKGVLGELEEKISSQKSEV